MSSISARTTAAARIESNRVPCDHSKWMSGDTSRLTTERCQPSWRASKLFMAAPISSRRTSSSRWRRPIIASRGFIRSATATVVWRASIPMPAWCAKRSMASACGRSRAVSRGFARNTTSACTPPIRSAANDFDGRGNLSDRALGDFCLFLLRTMLDQIGFMAGLLELGGLCQRIERHLIFERLHLESRIRERLVRLLKATVINGEVARGSVPDLIGARETVARETIRIALAEELVDSPTPKGPLSIVFSAQTLDSYFPQLFQDLPVAPNGLIGALGRLAIYEQEEVL